MRRGRPRQNAAGNRQARGCGGAQSASLPSALKRDTPRTLPHAHAVTPMRLHRVLRASAPSHHASWWRAPPSSAASRRVRVSRHRSGGLELPCDPSHLPSVHDMGSFFSRPVLIFRTILNRATNGFVTAVSRVPPGGKWQTQALSAVSHRDLSGELTWGAHRRIAE